MSVSHRLAGLALSGCVAAGPAWAQSAQPGDAARRWEPAPAAVSLVDMGAVGPRQRPRLALRMRFDAAERAMRSLGVEAEDCSSLVRSHTRMQADQPGGGERLAVSVSFAINCRFF